MGRLIVRLFGFELGDYTALIAPTRAEQAWQVSIEDIKARNYNLDIKNPHIGEQISHDPDELLIQYADEMKEIASLRDQLRNLLNDAILKAGAK